MLKRLLAGLFCAAVVLLSGCSDSESGAKKFTVGFDSDFPPYGYVENGVYKGFDLDLAREVAKRNGWEIVLKPINWDAKDMELNSGSIDCIWNGFTMNGREHAYEWSDPYVDNSQVVLVRKESGIRDLAGLAGKIAYAQFLHDGSEVRLREPQKTVHTNLNSKTPDQAVTLELPVIKPDVEVPVIELFLK